MARSENGGGVCAYFKCRSARNDVRTAAAAPQQHRCACHRPAGRRGPVVRLGTCAHTLYRAVCGAASAPRGRARACRRDRCRLAAAAGRRAGDTIVRWWLRPAVSARVGKRGRDPSTGTYNRGRRDRYNGRQRFPTDLEEGGRKTFNALCVRIPVSRASPVSHGFLFIRNENPRGS